jgi:beta-N-acetylhexosaminidase
LNTTLDLSELDRKVGQLFITGIPGPFVDEKTEHLIRDYNPAGVVLFSRNIEDPVQLAGLCRDLQDISMKYHGSPLFTAVDQEGGRVARLKEPFSVFPGNESIGKDEDPVTRAKEFARITAREMKMVGLNMNFAPVVDVRFGEPERHLRGRMFSEDYEMVSLLGRMVVRTLQENGVLAVAKHFPGLGRAAIDPHDTFLQIELDRKEIDEVNLMPFRAVIEEDVSGIMTSHAVYPALDGKQPATLSHAVLEDLLREEMGFDGLIITDDLEMGAIAKKWGVARGALASFSAGADILLICEDQQNFLESVSLIRQKVLQEEIPKERLAQSNRRVINAKSKFPGLAEDISIADIKAYFRI